MKNFNTKEIFALAVQNHQKNNLKVAEDLYKKVLKINPKDVDTYYNLGKMFSELNKYEEAISSYKKAIEINFNQADVHNNLGVIFRNLGNHKKAIIFYENAIKINPSYVNAYNNLGTILGELNYIIEAKKILLDAGIWKIIIYVMK